MLQTFDAQSGDCIQNGVYYSLRGKNNKIMFKLGKEHFHRASWLSLKP